MLNAWYFELNGDNVILWYMQRVCIWRSLCVAFSRFLYIYKVYAPVSHIIPTKPPNFYLFPCPLLTKSTSSFLPFSSAKTIKKTKFLTSFARTWVTVRVTSGQDVTAFSYWCRFKRGRIYRTSQFSRLFLGLFRLFPSHSSSFFLSFSTKDSK